MSDTCKLWAPRYVLYARSQGRTPEAQLAHDEDAWPGGRNAGLMIWNSRRWAEFRRLHGMGVYDYITEEGQRDFDVWLTRQVEVDELLVEFV